MNIPKIIEEFILKSGGKKPETEAEVNYYLDLINHSKKYIEAFELEQMIGKRMMKKFGFNTTDEIKKEGESLKRPF